MLNTLLELYKSLKNTSKLTNLSFRVIFLMLIAILLQTCSKTKKVEPKIEIHPIYNPLEYEYSEIDTTFGNCDSAFCNQIVINYPVLKNDSLARIQQRIIVDLVYWKSETQTDDASLSKLVAEQEEIYNEVIENDLSMGQNWYLNLAAHIDYNNNGILSYTVTKDAFSGGAHPIYESILVSLFLEKELTPINWADLFEEDRLVPLREYVKLHFFEFHGLDYSKPVNDQGFWFESGDFELNNNFSLQKDGIAILYNHYEVAPYSTGPTSLFLPWADIRTWLKPEYQKMFK